MRRVSQAKYPGARGAEPEPTDGDAPFNLLIGWAGLLTLPLLLPFALEGTPRRERRNHRALSL